MRREWPDQHIYRGEKLVQRISPAGREAPGRDAPMEPETEYSRVITHVTLLPNSRRFTFGENTMWEWGKVVQQVNWPNQNWLRMSQRARDALAKAGYLKKAPKDATKEMKSLVNDYGERKRDLPVLVPSVEDVPAGTRRKGLDYRHHSGCYSYDLDDGPLEGMEGDARRAMVQAALDALEGCPHEVASGVSVSGDGWTIISGPKAATEAEHHYYLRAIRERLPEAVRSLIPDKGQTEIGRLRYLVAGAFIRYNPSNTQMVVPPPPAAEEAPPRAARSSGNRKRRTPEEWMAAWPHGLEPLVQRSTQWEGPCPSCFQETGTVGDDRFHITVDPPHMFGCRYCVDPTTGKPDMRPYYTIFGWGGAAQASKPSLPEEGGGTWFRIGVHLGKSLRATWRYVDRPEGPTWARFQNGCWQEVTTQDRALIGFISARRFRIAGELEGRGWRKGAKQLITDRLWNAQKHVGSDLWDGLRTSCLGQVPEPLPYHVGVENGCVDMKSGDLHPHRPACGQRALTAGRYLPEAHEGLAKLLAQHLSPVFTVETQKAYLELIGLSLTGEAATYRGLALVRGAERSGKGGAVRLQRAALAGRSAAINADWFMRRAKDIDAETANLLHRRPDSISVSEVGVNSLGAHRRKFLAAVGGEDELSARRPHGATVAGKLTSLWWSSCVELPTFDVGDGISERLAVLLTIKTLSPGVKRSEMRTFTQDLMDAVVTGAIFTIRASGFFDDTPAGYVAPGGAAGCSYGSGSGGDGPPGELAGKSAGLMGRDSGRGCPVPGSGGPGGGDQREAVWYPRQHLHALEQAAANGGRRQRHPAFSGLRVTGFLRGLGGYLAYGPKNPARTLRPGKKVV